MRSFIQIVLLLCIGFLETKGQTLMPLPPHGSIYTGTVRGYWFTAPTNFTIVGLKVSPEAGLTDQFIHVMKINDPVPVAFPTLSTNFNTLAYIANAPNNVVQLVNIPVTAGDIIGILGAVGPGTANSYSGSVTPFATTINAFPLTLNRLLYQGAITAGPAPNYSTEGAGTPISRIEMYYSVGVPCATNLNNAVVLGPDEVCPKVNFNLTVGIISTPSNLNMTGLTHQWQVSSNGVSWTNFTGTVSSSGVLTDAITSGTYYRCIVTCTATSQTFTTPAKLVKIAPFYYCYCATTATTTAGADIGNVTVNALPSNAVLVNNGIATPVENNATANKGYSFFSKTLPAIPLYQDSSYKFRMSQINSAAFVPSVGIVYIDYNRNGTFDDSEAVHKQSTLNVLPDPGLITLPTFKIPTWAQFGLTGMRVIIKGGNTDPDTCGNYANGETEDYLVDLRYIPCNGKPSPGVILGDTSMCIGYKYILTDTTYQKKRFGVDRYWQISPDGAIWSDIAGSLNKDTLTRIFTGQPLHYRLVTTCSFTNDTDYTVPHKVNLKAAYKCYCFSQSTGTKDDTSDIGAFKLAKFEVSDNGTHLLNAKAFSQRTDYTDLAPIAIDVDSVYEFYIFHTMPYNNHADGKVTVFVDFNNNKKYDIPEERIYTGFTSIGNHVRLGNLIIPNNVIVNMPTGMRVIINNDVAPNIPSDEACGTYLSGETEDFIVEFSRPFGVGVKDAEGVNQLSLSPNPTNGRFQVQFKGASAKDGVMVKVMSVTGQVVLQQAYAHNGGIFRQELDMSNMVKGVYMVEVLANGQKMTKKLTVQ